MPIMLACLIVGLTSVGRDTVVLRTGTSDDGGRCLLEVLVRSGQVARFWLPCDGRDLEVPSSRCSLPLDPVPGRGFHHQIACRGTRHGSLYVLDTRDDSTTIPLGVGRLRIAWDPDGVHDRPLVARSFLAPPVHPGDLQWWRWLAVSGLLQTTALAIAWRYRPRRLRDVAQLEVQIDAWPPVGPLRVLSGDWPTGAPLALSPDAGLEVDRPGPGRFWIAGRREGGRGGGLREAEPRFEPTPGRGYLLRRRPVRWTDFEPRPPVGFGWIVWWLFALLAPTAAGSPVLPWLTLVAGLAAAGVSLVRMSALLKLR